MTTLTERYIYAATRRVPESGRADLSAELTASIADAIDARVEAGEPRAEAERSVLTELGDPERLAADYNDQPAYLIGPRYYFDWLRLERLLFSIVLPLALLGVALGQLLGGSDFGAAIGELVVLGLTISLHLLFWPTLVFAILERQPASWRPRKRGFAADGHAVWTVDWLPEIRAPGVGITELVSSLLWAALLIGALVWDRLVGFVSRDGERVSLIDPGAWNVWVPVLMGIGVAQAILAMVVFRVGRWTAPLAVANAVLVAVFAAVTVWLITQGALFNPAFFVAISGADSTEVISVVGITVGCIVAASALWSIIDVARKTVRGPRPTRS